MWRGMRIHCRHEPELPHRTRLLGAVPTLTFGELTDEAIDVLVAGRPTDAEIAAIREGGALVIPWAGLPVSTREQALTRPDLNVYNLHHNAGIVAEHALGLLLAVSRRLVTAHQALAKGDWRMRYADDDCPCLSGGRAVILGMGAIGRCLAPALEALGMEVVGIRRRTTPTLDDLGAVLPDTTALIVALPHTPRTDRLVDAARLARLPRHAIVVNVGRGRVIDEDALYEALAEQRLFGAGIDVWWQYPDSVEARTATLPARPFHELDNVVLSPHRAAHGTRADPLRYAHLAGLLADLVAGRVPATRVFVEEGY